MLKLISQNFLISSSVPSSWAPNWLVGTPTTIRPLSLNPSYSFCRSSYCLVKPQLLATFTNNIVLPIYFERSKLSPFIEFILKSKNVFEVSDIVLLKKENINIIK